MCIQKCQLCSLKLFAVFVKCCINLVFLCQRQIAIAPISVWKRIKQNVRATIKNNWGFVELWVTKCTTMCCTASTILCSTYCIKILLYRLAERVGFIWQARRVFHASQGWRQIGGNLLIQNKKKNNMKK